MDRLPLETQKEIILDERSQVIAQLRIDLTKYLSQPDNTELLARCSILIRQLNIIAGILWGLDMAQASEVPV